MAKILCVEDEPDIQCDIVEELSDAGHIVTTATTGEEGLAAIAENEFDLIICDSLMPVMTGLEFFEKLRNEYPELNEIPFVFLSAHADKTHVDDGLERGADAYLTKPVDFSELLQTINSLLGRGRLSNRGASGDTSDNTDYPIRN